VARASGSNPITRELLTVYLRSFLAQHRGRMVGITAARLGNYLSRRGFEVGKQFLVLALRNYAPREVRVDGVRWRLSKVAAGCGKRRLYIYRRAPVERKVFR